MNDLNPLPLSLLELDGDSVANPDDGGDGFDIAYRSCFEPLLERASMINGKRALYECGIGRVFSVDLAAHTRYSECVVEIGERKWTGRLHRPRLSAQEIPEDLVSQLSRQAQ
jgi:hypothetical protein